jgi:hypothetical protein
MAGNLRPDMITNIQFASMLACGSFCGNFCDAQVVIFMVK